MKRDGQRSWWKRTLPPAGGFAADSSLIAAANRIGSWFADGSRFADGFPGADGGRGGPPAQVDSKPAAGSKPAGVASTRLAAFLLHLLQDNLGAADAAFLSSGTASLTQLFRALRSAGVTRTHIGMSAYTCPDIAAAAVRAGFGVVAFDLDPRTLEIDLGRLDSAALQTCAAVVLSNLYGLPDNLEHWKQLAAVHQFAIIDDACQAAFSRRAAVDSNAVDSSAGVSVGCADETFGILSFGRGKAIQGMGGGAIVFPKSGSTAQHLDSVRQQIAASSLTRPAELSQGAVYMARAAGVAARLFEHPARYGIPSSIAWLGLGTTEFNTDFRIERAQPVQLLHAAAQLGASGTTRAEWTANARRWYEALRNLDVVQPFAERFLRTGVAAAGEDVAPIRYPILLRTKTLRDRVFAACTSAGVGASLSYPEPLTYYEELHLQRDAAPQAQTVSETILTLPIHRYVQAGDVQLAAGLIGEVLKKGE